MNFLYGQIQRTQDLKCINSLTADLAQYGLCPEDWCITKERGLFYKIENLSEPDFCFRGRIQHLNGRMRWQSLHLLSI